MMSTSHEEDMDPSLPAASVTESTVHNTHTHLMSVK